jgi:hypothetical protein
MKDTQINKNVARALSVEWNAIASDGLIIDGKSPSVNYCNNPSDAWPIIVENGICITSPTLCSKSNFWHASWNENGGDSLRGLIAFSDKNPLRAAMICFLKLKDATDD